MNMKRILRFFEQLFVERVLFADLDGTIIVTRSGKIFSVDCEDWQFKPHIIEALKAYRPTAMHIISNQGGIEKGFVNIEDFNRKAIEICRQLGEELGINVTYDYCTSTDPTHPDRKNPRMIDSYCTDALHGTDCSKRNCLMIGDASGKAGQFSDSDRKCAENANVAYMDVDDFIEKYSPQA